MPSKLHFTPLLSFLRTTALLLPLSCTSNTITLLDDDDGGTSSDGTTTSATTAETTLPDPTSPTTTSTEPADDTVLPDPTTGSQFIPPPDGGGNTLECNIWLQDCPAGEKCMPWANDGGSSWNATRCSPIAEDPGGVDDPCMVEGSGVSGIDDCDLGLMCWDVDPETNEGQCVPICIGSSESDLHCEDPGRQCMLGGDGLITLCLPVCDPIAQDCAEGQACYPVQDHWICAPDASGEMGNYGDPCEFINVCDPGLVCMGSASAPPGLPCEGAAGCCLQVCDVPLGDAQCPGAADGEVCQPWYDEGTAPVGYDDVGVCMLP